MCGCISLRETKNEGVGNFGCIKTFICRCLKLWLNSKFKPNTLNSCQHTLFGSRVVLFKIFVRSFAIDLTIQVLYYPSLEHSASCLLCLYCSHPSPTATPPPLCSTAHLLKSLRCYASVYHLDQFKHSKSTVALSHMMKDGWGGGGSIDRHILIVVGSQFPFNRRESSHSAPTPDRKIYPNFMTFYGIGDNSFEPLSLSLRV